MASSGEVAYCNKPLTHHLFLLFITLPRFWNFVRNIKNLWKVLLCEGYEGGMLVWLQYLFFCLLSVQDYFLEKNFRSVHIKNNNTMAWIHSTDRFAKKYQCVRNSLTQGSTLGAFARVHEWKLQGANVENDLGAPVQMTFCTQSNSKIHIIPTMRIKTPWPCMIITFQ